MYTPSKSLHGLLDGIIKLSVKQNKSPLAASDMHPKSWTQLKECIFYEKRKSKTSRVQCKF